MPDNENQLPEFLQFANELADVAQSVTLRYFRAAIEVDDKGGTRFDPVTVADREAERVMRDLIRSRYPDHGILGEEEGTTVGASNFTWVLDPIDGTRAFITGLPLWGTLIGLNDGTQPVLGVMNQPYTGERYVGTSHAAWRNGGHIKTRKCTSLADARLMCTTPEMFDSHVRRKAYDTVAGDVEMVRYGGDCYAYCMLASGFVDIVIESGLKPYDIQSLIPIIEGAGGVVTSWDGRSAQNGGTVVACGDPDLHIALISRLRHAV